MSRVSWMVVVALCTASPSDAAETRSDTRSTFLKIARPEAIAAGLPVDIADAVMAIESSFDPSRIGSVGEIGLMQVRPATARMLGFSGTAEDLADPATNIRYGIRYLAGAWRLGGGDLCRTLMKYRAGHREEVMSARSIDYCRKARSHLASIGSPLAGPEAMASDPQVTPMRPALSTRSKSPVKLRGPAFWAVHEARIKAINARIERRWKQRAS